MGDANDENDGIVETPAKDGKDDDSQNTRGGKGGREIVPMSAAEPEGDS